MANRILPLRYGTFTADQSLEPLNNVYAVKHAIIPPVMHGIHEDHRHFEDIPPTTHQEMTDRMKITAIDGHPGTNRLVTALIDRYLDAATQSGATVTKFTLREMAFDPILHEGYHHRQDWEPDLTSAAQSLQESDHLLIGFPLWWGSQPALLKGFFDRVFLPGYAFKYHKNDPFWDRLLVGRSADVFITADTPKAFLRWSYGAPVFNQTGKQILGFSGFKPVRQYYFAPIRNKSPKAYEKWLRKAEALGRKRVS